MAPPRKKASRLKSTAKYYRENPTARRKKAATDKKINARPGQKAKRRELGKINREADKRGTTRTGTDYDHKQGRRISSSANRGQAEKSRLKGSRRRKRN